MTTPQEQALRALAAQATKGPWQVVPTDHTHENPEPYVVFHRDRHGFTDDDSTLLTEANAAYVAAASPDTVLALLDRIAALEAVCATAATLLDVLDGGNPYPLAKAKEELGQALNANLDALLEAPGQRTEAK